MFQASWYKNKIVFQIQPKINVVSTVNFNIDSTLIKWYCFDIEIRLSFQCYIKILNFQPSWYKIKIVFQSQPKINVASTVNSDVDSTLINWRCFDVEMWLSFQRYYKDFKQHYIRPKLFLESTQNQRCFKVEFYWWVNLDKSTLN